MNILQVLPALNLGGVETGTVDLAKYLIKSGHHSVVVSSGGELVKDLEACGALHYHLPVHRKSLIAIWKAIKPLSRIIEREKIDIVQADSRVPAWIAYFACRRTRRVLITTCHGYYSKHPFSYVMGWGKLVIAISNVVARHMIEDFGVLHERVRVIPRSVDLEQFRFLPPDQKRKEEFHIGIVARITPIKGHMYFFKAMAKVARVVPKLKIWVVGDAPASRQDYKEQVQVLVRRLGLWHCTEFLGAQRDIPGIMAQMDVLVLATTAHEAFGRVIIEAQAAGVPVVATRVGGVVDIIEDDRNGLLVAPADPQGMSEAVLKIFKDKEFARRLAENAYQKVQEKYSVGLMTAQTLDVYQEALSNFRALVIKLSSLGDVILSSAALRSIREKFPKGWRISALVGEESRDVLLGCPYIDELIVCDLKNKDRGLKGLLKTGSALRKRNFDLVVDLQNNRKSHILSYLTLAPDRYGYRNKKFGFLLNHSIQDDCIALEPVKHQFRVLGMLGIELKDPRLELWPSQDDADYVKELFASEWLSTQQKIIGINLSASRRWQTKAWPMGHIIKLCEELGRRDLRVVLTGTGQDVTAAQDLTQKVKGTKLINACGKTTINQLACLIRECSAYVSSDSAPLHVAAAAGVPFVALFGPTDPSRHLFPAKNFILLKKGLKCGPCYKPKCKNKRCMELISPQEVLEAIDRLLK